MKYKNCRVWADTNKRLKVMSAKREITVIELIDRLIKAEEKRTNDKD